MRRESTAGDDSPRIGRTGESLRSVAARVPWARLLLGWALAYAVGAATALLVQSAGWWVGAAWERKLLLAVHATAHPVLDALMLTLPLFGTNYTIAPVVLLSAIVLARRGYRTVALHLLAVQLGSWALNPALKFSFVRDRPTLFEQRGQHDFPAFPSGHSIASVSVLLTIAYLLHRTGRGRWAYAVVGAYILLNAYSRLYLGVHWPTDVIAGSIIGGFWLVWVLVAFRRVHWPESAPRGSALSGDAAPRPPLRPRASGH